MPIKTRKKKIPAPGAKKNRKTSASPTKIRKVAKKASIMKVLAPSKTNLDKAPVDNNTHAMPYTYPRKCPDTVLSLPHHLRRQHTSIPMKGPLNFLNSKQSMYGIVSPDNLGMDSLSFGESLKAYEELIPLDFKGTTLHGSKHERV